MRPLIPSLLWTRTNHDQHGFYHFSLPPFCLFFQFPHKLSNVSPVFPITLLSFLLLLPAHEHTHVPDGFGCPFPLASPSSFPPCSDFRPKYESSVRPCTVRGARPSDPLGLGGCFMPMSREGGKGGRVDELVVRAWGVEEKARGLCRT